MDILQTSIAQFLAAVNHDNARATEISKRIAESIESKQIKLVELVKALGDYLTADDDLLRPKATNCLSQTLDQLSPAALSKHDIQVLITFYLSKMEDVKSTKETLSGIDSLVTMENFPLIHLKPILINIRDQYVSTQHLASTRFFTFDILENIFTKYPEIVENKLQKPFIETFIHIASGEKDPKNLLKSFSLNAKISKKLNIDDFKDSLFDVLFCYFPISFKPPKDDPYKITSEQLKNELRQAIAANALFSEDTYPNLLEKLTSTSPTVKHDTIDTINLCISNYGPESIKEHYIELWNALKFEILHGDPDDDEDLLFPPILEIFTTMTRQLSSSDEHFEKFLDMAYSELKENVQNATTKQKQSCILLSAIASANPQAFDRIVHPTLTLLLNQQTLSVQNQRQLITNIGFFTSAYILVFGTNSDELITPGSDNSLLGFKDEILILLGKSLMSSSKVEVSIRTLSIAELTKLTTLLDFITPSELSLIVQYFTETVLVDDNEYVYGSGISGLIQIGQDDHSVLLEITYPKLIDLLPEQQVEEFMIDDQVKPRTKVLEVFKSITRAKETGDWLLTRLVSKLKEIKGDDTYGFEICNTCLVIIKEIQRLSPFDTDGYLNELYPELLRLVNKSDSDEYLESIGEFIKLIVGYSKKTIHQSILNDSIELFIVQNEILSKQNKLINIFVKIVSALDKSVKFDKIDDFFKQLIDFTEAQEFDDTYTKLGYLQLIAILINKFISDVTPLTEYLQSDDITPNKLEIFTWISKGVILKMDPKSIDFITKLIDLLQDHTWGTTITKSFEIIVVDLVNFEKFKKRQNNNVRLLYKQSLFQMISPLIITRFKSTQDLRIKSNLLTSLSYILKHTKREIIIPHLNEFFPLLLQSLTLPKSTVRYASIKTILSTIEEIPDLVSSHLTTLIPALLGMSQPKIKLNTVEVRLISLNCLEAFTHAIKLEKLVPYQDKIIKELAPVLGDAKRSVRKAAIDTRQAYYELGRTVD